MTAKESIEKLNEMLASGKLHPDEPFFWLRAQDRAAAKTVSFWADEADELGAPIEMVKGAQDIAEAMDDWPVKQVPGRNETRVGTV